MCALSCTSSFRQCLVLQYAPYKNDKYSFSGIYVGRNRYQVVTCLVDEDYL